MNNPYTVLGLAEGASEEEAKAAFRRLAKTCHPDLHPNDPEAERRFKEINSAYETIRNPNKAEGERFNQGPFTWGFRSGDFPFEDLFGQFNMHVRRNPDVHVEVALTLEEAFTGKTVNIHVRSPTRNLKVRLPPGVDSGMRLRVPQGADQPHPHFPPGDLYIIVRVAPHPVWKREGKNLLTTVPVSAFDVLLGTEIEVTGIDGKSIKVAIPAGQDSSRRLRLAEQGMPDGHGYRGDLLVELFIHFPELTEEQRALIKQAAELKNRPTS